MDTALLEGLGEGRWYWHERSEFGRRRVQIAAKYVTDTGVTIIATDDIVERASYPRGWVVELAPDPLGPDGQA
ncbi:hypothetical protein [Saccharopolyspora griseoalba]|uniref:Uncharacterized protein n=1 Tax=Saccharopolyspora griseoalba TaxID=1431848 RepID=A0ABW2LSH1_9PSEU